MRKQESNATKNIWNVKMITNGEETYNKDFKTIQEIADDLGMSYHQVADLKNKRCKRKQIRFKFQPEIIFTRIGKTQKEYWNERRIEKAQKILESV
tara:strand:- start:477 stop:764 length:288 start_codon:yes stop_codon:yes gene_type:complete